MKKFALLALLMLSACAMPNSWKIWENEENTTPVAEQQEAKLPELSADELGVNPYLWKASLAKLKFMPLSSADSKGGVIVTDWASVGDNTGESFKVTVNVLSKDLRSDGIQVVVLKRYYKDGKYINSETDKKLAFEVEKSILTEARKLFRRDVMGREV